MKTPCKYCGKIRKYKNAPDICEDCNMLIAIYPSKMRDISSVPQDKRRAEVIALRRYNKQQRAKLRKLFEKYDGRNNG